MPSPIKVPSDVVTLINAPATGVRSGTSLTKTWFCTLAIIKNSPSSAALTELDAKPRPATVEQITANKTLSQM